jgi:hypothetical protein
MQEVDKKGTKSDLDTIRTPFLLDNKKKFLDSIDDNQDLFKTRTPIKDVNSDI